MEICFHFHYGISGCWIRLDGFWYSTFTLGASHKLTHECANLCFRVRLLAHFYRVYLDSLNVKGKKVNFVENVESNNIERDYMEFNDVELIKLFANDLWNDMKYHGVLRIRILKRKWSRNALDHEDNVFWEIQNVNSSLEVEINDINEEMAISYGHTK